MEDHHNFKMQCLLFCILPIDKFRSLLVYTQDHHFKISYIFVHISACVHNDELFLKYSRCTCICKWSTVTMLSQVKDIAHKKALPGTLQQYHQFRSVTKQRNEAANWRTRGRVPGNSWSCKSASVEVASFSFPGKRGLRIHVISWLWFVSRTLKKSTGSNPCLGMKQGHFSFITGDTWGPTELRACSGKWGMYTLYGSAPASLRQE